MAAKHGSTRISSLEALGVVLVLSVMSIAVRWTSPPAPATSSRAPGTVGHPTVPFPAALDGDRAESVYQAIKLRLQRDYAESGDPVVLSYQRWKRFNAAPYRSPDHGQRFVNHYANDLAAAYGEYGGAGPLPVGSVVVKDSFVVTESGTVRTGPFFMMEKMPPGFRSAAGSWRFMAIGPDGNVAGMTGGMDAKRVAFCADCHEKAGPAQDYLFFPPEEARLGRSAD